MKEGDVTTLGERKKCGTQNNNGLSGPLLFDREKKNAGLAGGSSRRSSLDVLAQLKRRQSYRRIGHPTQRRRRIKLARKSQAANKNIWFDDKGKKDREETEQAYWKKTLGPIDHCSWDSRTDRTVTPTATPRTSICDLSVLEKEVQDIYFSDTDCDGDDELSTDDEEDYNKRSSQVARLYEKMKGDLDLVRYEGVGDKHKESANAVACAISILHTIHKDLIPAIEYASFAELQGVDRENRPSAAVRLVRGVERFNDGFIALNKSNPNSFYHSPEINSALSSTRRLLVKCMAVPFHSNEPDREKRFISALTKPKVKKTLERLCGKLLYNYSAVERLKGACPKVERENSDKDFIAIGKEYPAPVVQQANVAAGNGDEHNMKLLSNEKQFHNSPNMMISLYSDSSGQPVKNPPCQHRLPEKAATIPASFVRDYPINDNASSLTKPEVIPHKEELYNNALKAILIGSSGSGKSTFFRWLKGSRQRKGTSSSTSNRVLSLDQKKSIGINTHIWNNKKFHTGPHESKENTELYEDEVKTKFSVWDFKQGSDKVLIYLLAQIM